MSSALPLQRSKKLLESEGFHVWIVEVWMSWGGYRRDLFHMADLVAIRRDRKGVLAIQCTGEDVQDHVKKLLEGYTDSKGKAVEANIYLKPWLEAGNPFFIWAWRKRGAAGKRKTYQLRQLEFTLKDGQIIVTEIQTCTAPDANEK